jgi:hypothetical protein
LPGSVPIRTGVEIVFKDYSSITGEREQYHQIKEEQHLHFQFVHGYLNLNPGGAEGARVSGVLPPGM